MILNFIFWIIIHNLGIGQLWSIKKNEYYEFKKELWK